MPLTLLPLLINSAVILLFIILSAVLTASGYKYGRHIGDLAIQTPLKWRILRIILFMILAGLATAIFNILLFWGVIVL